MIAGRRVSGRFTGRRLLRRDPRDNPPTPIGQGAMRNELTIAVGELHHAIGHHHWHGRTFRQFWEWFNGRCIELVAAAEPGELDALEQALLDVRAAVEEAAYLVPSDRLDEVIEPPM